MTFLPTEVSLVNFYLFDKNYISRYFNLILSRSDSFIIFRKNLLIYKFFKNKFLYKDFLSMQKTYLNYFNLLMLKYFNFNLFIFSFIIGLGYKRKINKDNTYLYIYLGDRHWSILPIPVDVLVFPVKKRSFIMLSNSKSVLTCFLNQLKNLKSENFYKIKGIFFVWSQRRWLNVRYIKIRFLKTKLSKKQQFM